MEIGELWKEFVIVPASRKRWSTIHSSDYFNHFFLLFVEWAKSFYIFKTSICLWMSNNIATLESRKHYQSLRRFFLFPTAWFTARLWYFWETCHNVAWLVASKNMMNALGLPGLEVKVFERLLCTSVTSHTGPLPIIRWSQVLIHECYCTCMFKTQHQLSWNETGQC